MLVWSILNIILLFKIWDMTNDVRDIRNILESINYSRANTSNNISSIVSSSTVDFKVGEIVVIKSSGKEMKIVQIFPDGDIACVPANNKLGLRKILNKEEILKLRDYKE